MFKNLNSKSNYPLRERDGKQFTCMLYVLVGDCRYQETYNAAEKNNISNCVMMPSPPTAKNAFHSEEKN